MGQCINGRDSNGVASELTDIVSIANPYQNENLIYESQTYSSPISLLTMGMTPPSIFPPQEQTQLMRIVDPIALSTSQATDSTDIKYQLKQGSKDSDRFFIDEITGQVTLLEDPDFEAKPSYSSQLLQQMLLAT